MTDNIIPFKGITTLDIDPQAMLRAIADESPENVFLIVWPNTGEMPTYHSSTADIATVLMRVQGFVHKFYNGDLE